MSDTDTNDPDANSATPTLDPVQSLQMQIGELTQQLRVAQRELPPIKVQDYTFQTLHGDVSLSALFGGHDKLLAIHNMGQACRYCTLWGDGFDGLVPHLESALALVMLSKDPPELQNRFARSRGWRIRMASHGGGNYMQEQVGFAGMANMPGVAYYHRRNGQIYRQGGGFFGPGDLYCSLWHLLALADIGEGEFTPQFSYWQRPSTLEDGGENLAPA